MYKIIDTAPSREQIEAYGMQLTEEDVYINYKIELANLSDDEKNRLCATYGLAPQKLEEATTLVLALSTEV